MSAQNGCRRQAPDDLNTFRYRVGGDGKGELLAEDEALVAERLRQANIGLLNRYLT